MKQPSSSLKLKKLVAMLWFQTKTQTIINIAFNKCKSYEYILVEMKLQGTLKRIHLIHILTDTITGGLEIIILSPLW